MLKRIEVFYEEDGWFGCVGPLMLTGLSSLLPAPKGKRKGIFYFTELGFIRFGIPTIEIIKNENTQYRVITISKKILSITYQDKFQVMGYRTRCFFQ